MELYSLSTYVLQAFSVKENEWINEWIGNHKWEQFSEELPTMGILAAVLRISEGITWSPITPSTCTTVPGANWISFLDTLLCLKLLTSSTGSVIMLDFVELSNQTVLGIPCQQQLQNFEVSFFSISPSQLSIMLQCATIYTSVPKTIKTNKVTHGKIACTHKGWDSKDTYWGYKPPPPNTKKLKHCSQLKWVPSCEQGSNTN
jgi:hypothetical protein